MKSIFKILLLSLLVACSGKGKEAVKDQSSLSFEDICFEKFTSESLGVNIFHSKNWNPYEPSGNMISLEFLALEDPSRKYDSEVSVEFSTQTMSEIDFQGSFQFKLDERKKQLDEQGSLVYSKLTDNGKIEFANKTWRTINIKDSLVIEGVPTRSSTNCYLWYSSKKQIVITTFVKGNDIPGIKEEINCILNKMEFLQ